MKNKKLMVLLVSVVTILLFVVVGLNINNISKIRGSVTYPTTNGVKLNCEKETIKIGEKTTCTLVGHLTGGARGVEGKIKTTDGISAVVTPDDIWLTMSNENDTNDNLTIMYYKEEPSPVDFNIATIEVEGITKGEKNLKFEKYNLDTPVLADSNHEDVEISEDDVNITVIDEADEAEAKNADLSEITLNIGTLSPAFDKDKTEYTVEVENSVDRITIGATQSGQGASVIGTGERSLKEGENVVELVVTSADGTTKKYTIKITRKPKEQSKPTEEKSKDNKLKDVKIEGATMASDFDPNKDEFTLIVEDDQTEITIIPQVSDSKAKVSYDPALTNNKLKIEKDVTVLTVIVEAENGSKKYYKYTIMRKSYYDKINSESNNSILVPNTGNGVLKYGVLIGLIIIIVLLLIMVKRRQGK